MKKFLTSYRRLPLRYKLLILLVTLPSVSLALYLALATRIFEKDKMAYVYDSSSSASRSLAAQLRTEVEGLVSTMSDVIQGYDPHTNSFSEYSKKIFYENSKLKSMTAFRYANGNYSRFAVLDSKLKEDDKSADFSDNIYTGMIKSAADHELALKVTPDQQKIILALKIGNPNDPRAPFVAVVGRAPEFVEAISASETYFSYLVDSKGKVIISPKKAASPILSFKKWDFFKKMMKSTAPEGVTESLDRTGEKRFITSFSRTGIGGYSVVTLVNKEMALEAVNVLVTKSVLFFIALISFAVMVSVIAARGLTKSINDLYKASQKVSQGDFGIQVENNSQDEIGALTDSFNQMSGKISSLLKESVDKARMEKELETAKTVQNMLFPEPIFSFGNLKGAGFYEPASECGGDWWNYSKIGKFIFIWLGDATGHGAAAALTTSAAKSAASVIENLPGITPAAAMDFLNKAIYDTSKGKMMMTFFLAAIDTETGDMAYATASHDPPYLFRNKEGALTRQDVVLLQEKINPRLGEDTTMKSEQCNLKLAKGDYLIFYTDGVIAAENSSKEKLGERSFISTTLEALNKKLPPTDVVTHISSKISEHRQNAALPDDITVVVCQYQ